MQIAIQKEKKIETVLEILLYVSCLFPFTMWIPAWYTGTDSQPYAFVISICILLYYGIVKEENKMPKALWFLGICVLFLGAYAICDVCEHGLLLIAKRYVTFASLETIPLAFFYICRSRGKVNEILIKMAIWIWLIVGVVQMWIIPDFASTFVMRQTTDLTRGVVSLATEPSAYGYICLFLLLFAWNFKKRRMFYMGLVLLQILGLAQSTVTLMYIGVYLIGYVLNDIWVKKQHALIKYIAILFAGAGLFTFAYMKRLLPYRMYQIITMLLHGDWNGLFKDGSIIKRLEGISCAVLRFVNNLGLPQGFGGERYFSGNGILLVEGGFVSLIILCMIGLIIWNAYPKIYRLMFAFGFLLVMFSAIPYSCPIIGMYLGLCVYQGKNTDILINEAGKNICKKWKLAILLAIGIASIAGGIRAIKDIQIENETYHPLVIENKYSSKEELTKLLSKEEYQEVEEAFTCWKILIETEDGMVQEGISREEAETIFNEYEVSFSYAQQRLCTLLIYEYMGKDTYEYLGNAQNGVIVRSGEASNRGVFLLFSGILGAVFVLGMYEGKKWNKG